MPPPALPWSYEPTPKSTAQHSARRRSRKVTKGKNRQPRAQSSSASPSGPRGQPRRGTEGGWGIQRLVVSNCTAVEKRSGKQKKDTEREGEWWWRTEQNSTAALFSIPITGDQSLHAWLTTLSARRRGAVGSISDVENGDRGRRGAV